MIVIELSNSLDSLSGCIRIVLRRWSSSSALVVLFSVVQCTVVTIPVASSKIVACHWLSVAALYAVLSVWEGFYEISLLVARDLRGELCPQFLVLDTLVCIVSACSDDFCFDLRVQSS